MNDSSTDKVADGTGADELALDGARKLLESATLSRLAYTGTDGSPRVIPIGFWWTGSEVVFCTAVSSPKVRASAKRPEVAITIDIGNTPADAEALLVRGSARLETVDGIPEEYISASAKALSPDEVAVFRDNVTGMYDQMVRISVTPTWARYFDFGAGRLPGFLQDLVAGRGPENER
jgi:hypothetical protein